MLILSYELRAMNYEPSRLWTLELGNPLARPRFPVRYTSMTVRNSLLLFVVAAASVLCRADDASFRHVFVPDLDGHQTKAVLTFSNQNKAVEVRMAKRAPVAIPYGVIDKCAYEFTKKHRINGETIATAPVAVGVVAMLTKSRSHWLEIDYHDGEIPKVFVLRMKKRDYIKILDALKAHTGIDAEILGNAEKR